MSFPSLENLLAVASASPNSIEILSLILAVFAVGIAFAILAAVRSFKKSLNERDAAGALGAGEAFEKTVRDEAERTRTAVKAEISSFRAETTHANATNSAALGAALAERSRELNDTLHSRFESFTNSLAEAAKTQSETLDKLREAENLAAAQNRKTLSDSLDKLRAENAKKLDEIRGVVDEKLQTTLEKRIGESFKLVSERLENVHKSLGEMQEVSASVDDLKRVLTNVKTRGTFGEIQLGSLLEDFLAPDQFVRNFKPKAGGNEIVEFAIKLPGNDRDSDRPVFLPIDSKFPIEDYGRIRDAAEKADAAGVEKASKALANVVEGFAADVSKKYISPPQTTNFAILFVPTEGLFAELLRRPGFAEKIQRERHVLLAGPTTLAALINSLKVGFQTLAIQKNSRQIEKALVDVKKDFEKFRALIDKLGKNLSDAQKTLSDVSGRHDQATKKLTRFEKTTDLAASSALDAAPTDIPAAPK